MEIVVENFRCFRGKQIVSLTPITLVVGENGTGKSTFLECVEDSLKSNRLTSYKEAKDTSRLLKSARIKKLMERFGNESGLFDALSIECTLPFQVKIHVDELTLDMAEAGSGIRACLPILVQCSISKKGETLVLQNPDANLHPKAQAALGSFFASLTRSRSLHFVIETHGDYLLDRIRQEVGKGVIRDQDVSILYFEKKNGRTKIHPITFDDFGNMVNAPKDYRKFNLEEEIRLLSRGAE